MINFAEFDSIMVIVRNLLNGFSVIVDYLMFSPNDFLRLVGIDVTLPAWAGANLTPLALMLGVALPLYLGYQFITWLLNVVT